VRTTGQRITFAEYPWLSGPIGGPSQIADEWLQREAERLGGILVEGGGLLERMSDLAGGDFDPSRLAKPIVDFYETTSEYRMEVGTQWSRAAWPFGWLITSIFSQRLDQLNLPLRPLDVADGMDSRIVLILDHSGSRLGAAWLRTLRATGQTVYSGWYGTVTLPGTEALSLRVVFPLPNGSITVFLRPEVRADGALVLRSPVGPLGTEGAYLIVSQADRVSGWVRRVPLAENFVVWVDEEGTLRADHDLAFRKIPVVQLRYRIDRIRLGRGAS
jgi:hypothetical protein